MSFQSIYSKVQPDNLLHVVMNALEAGSARTDLSPPDKFLQTSVIPLPLGKKIAPHIQNPRAPSGGASVTQESWVVMKGKLRVRLFDVDKAFLHETVLLPGFLLVTYSGGHSLECLEEGTVILEYKNGPYLGRDFETFTET